MENIVNYIKINNAMERMQFIPGPLLFYCSVKKSRWPGYEATPDPCCCSSYNVIIQVDPSCFNVPVIKSWFT